MNITIGSTSSFIERLSFLEAMDARLDSMFLSHNILGSLSLFGPVLLVCCAVLLFISQRKSPLFFASAGVAVSILVWMVSPSNSAHIAQAVKIESAVRGLPASEVLRAKLWDETLPESYVTKFRATVYIFDLRERIKGEKSELKAELARFEFIHSGELESLKKELLESAEKAKETGSATSGQMALLLKDK